MSAKTQPLQLQASDALILVDVQKDFLSGGALAVKDGDQVLSPLNRYIQAFLKYSRQIFSSRCWHPPGNCSFKEQGGPWPVHCQQHTPDAEFANDLLWDEAIRIISKGTDPKRDAYLGFEQTDLHQKLQDENISQLCDRLIDDRLLCAKHGPRRLSFGIPGSSTQRCHLRAINVEPNDGEAAIADMQAHGALLTTLDQVAV